MKPLSWEIIEEIVDAGRLQWGFVVAAEEFFRWKIIEEIVNAECSLLEFVMAKKNIYYSDFVVAVEDYL